MEKMTAIFLHRPILVKIVVFSVVFLGLKTVLTIRKEGFPPASQNRIVIQTVYPGASARDVALNVTGPIEDAMEEVSGLSEMTSVSREGQSVVTVVADDNMDRQQFERVYDSVGAALSSLEDLPADARAPVFSQVTSDDIPVIEVALSGSQENLKKVVPVLSSRLKGVQGVSQVEKIGFPDSEYHILVDPQKAKKHYVDLRQIMSAVKNRNVEGSGGTLESYVGQKKIVSYNKIENVDELLNINIRRNFSGKSVRVSDVAKVVEAREDLKLQVRNDGYSGVSLEIIKKPGYDLLETINDVSEVVKSQIYPAGVSFNLLNDKSALTRDRLRLLGGNALLGMFLVFLILMVVLGLRAAIWAAFSIPFSFFGMFIFLPALDISLNAITLGGCVLVLGMLVDDAIVITEQVFQEKEAGAAPLDAAAAAVKKVWAPVLGSSLTTMIAYYPVSQLGGLPGKFVWIIPVVVSLALLASLFDSYFLLPSHLCHGSHRKSAKKSFVVAAENIYKKVLKGVCRFRYGVLLIFLMLLISAGWIAATKMEKEPFPQDAAEGFTIQVSGVPGLSLEGATAVMGEIERKILKLPAHELSGFSVRIGTQSKSATTSRGSEASLGIIFVFLKPFSERIRTAAEISEGLRHSLRGIAGLSETTLLFELIRIGPPMGREYEIRISSSDDSLRYAKTNEIKTFLQEMPDMIRVEDDLKPGKNELNLEIDYNNLARLGLTVNDVLQTIRIAFDGVVVTDMVENNKKVDFRLRLNEQARAEIDYVKHLGVMNNEGKLVSMEHFLSFSESPSYAEINHFNGIATTTIFGQTVRDNLSSEKVLEAVKKKFPPGENFQISYGGEPVEGKKIFADLKIAALTAVLGVFLILSFIFNSFSTPLIVMSAIPFGVVGIVYAVAAHEMPLSMFVAISLIGLSGIIVNDSLVMVFTIREKLRKPKKNTELIIEGACCRLRPVLLTTVTTVAGLLPTAYGIGGFDPFISPMCLALAWGLVFGTAVVLILVPVLYALGEDLRNLFRAK